MGIRTNSIFFVPFVLSFAFIGYNFFFFLVSLDLVKLEIDLFKYSYFFLLSKYIYCLQ